MQRVCRENREQIEREYLALLIHKEELIDLVQIKPIELSTQIHREIFSYILDYYKQFGHISMEAITSDKMLEYFMSLLDEWFDDSNSINQLEKSEKAIEEFYKEDKIIELNKKLEGKKINYKTYMKQVIELDNTTTLIKNEVINRKELEANIQTIQVGIRFDKFPKLSKELKLLQNDLLVIGATTGVGKSGFLLNLMNDLMKDYQCIYFNLEMSKSNIYRRLIAINGNFAVYGIDNPTEYQKELMNKAIDNIEKSKISIINSVNNVIDIKKHISKIKDKNRHTIIFIDHIGLVRYQNKRSIYEETTEVIKELRKICLEYNCTVIAASQLNRGAYQAEEITLNMLKDSGELENSSRKIILLSYENKNDRENLEPIMKVDIAKNDNGSTGITRMKYWKIKQIFEEIQL